MELTDALAKAEKIVRQNGASAENVQLANWLAELITLRQDVTDLIALVRAQDQVDAARLLLDQYIQDVAQQKDPERLLIAKQKAEIAKHDLVVQQSRLVMRRTHAHRILNTVAQKTLNEKISTMGLIQQLVDPHITHICDAELDDLVESMKHLPPHNTAADEAHLISAWDKEDVSEQRAKVTFRIWQMFPKLVSALRQMRMRNNTLRTDVHDSQCTIRKLTGELAFMEFQNGLMAAQMEARAWLSEVECFNLGQHLVRMRAAGADDDVCSNAAESLYAVRDNAEMDYRMAATRWACLNLCR